jgi:hypothetical protein
LQLYKESARFMAFLDVDDVINPRGKNYAQDFDSLLSTNPHAAAFLFQRRSHRFEKSKKFFLYKC